MQTNTTIAKRHCDPSSGTHCLPDAWTDDQSRYSRLSNASAQLERLAADSDEEWLLEALDAVLDDLADLSGPHFVRASELPREQPTDAVADDDRHASPAAEPPTPSQAPDPDRHVDLRDCADREGSR